MERPVIDPEKSSREHSDVEPGSSLNELKRQRQKAFWWAIVAGIIIALIVSLFNPSLALLGGGMLVVLGLFGAGVSAVIRFADRYFDK